MADIGGEVASADEESIDRVDGVTYGGGSGVVEFNITGGVGVEVSEEVIEIGFEGTIGGESGCIWTEMVVVTCNSLSSGLTKEAD